MTGLNHNQLAEHIRKLIDYNWTDELTDYEADENDSREAHIFRTLVALDNYVEGTELTPESYLKAQAPPLATEELSMTLPVARALGKTNWPLLARQKETLLRITSYLEDNLSEQGDDPDVSRAEIDHLTGLTGFLDAVQDAAHVEGYPVEFLTEDEEDNGRQSDSAEV